MASSAHAAPHTGVHSDPRVAVPPTTPEETTRFLISRHLNVGDNFLLLAGGGPPWAF